MTFEEWAMLETYKDGSHKESAREAWNARQPEIDALRAEVAEMRKVLGPKCFQCGHWIKVQHGQSINPLNGLRIYCKQCQCEFYAKDVLRNPEIAAEMGIKEKV